MTSPTPMPTPALAASTWTVDPAATRAQFQARDVRRRPVLGTLPVQSGRVEVAADRTVVSVAAELDLSGVSTGHTKRDHDLRGRRFFDIERAPVLRFTGGPGRPVGEGRWLLPGRLTHDGADCPVELDVELLSADSGAVRVRATTSLDRRMIGIRAPRLLVGSRIEIAVEATLLPTEPPGRS